ncbi:Mobilization protein, partial [Dysosmobacter welbionis]
VLRVGAVFQIAVCQPEHGVAIALHRPLECRVCQSHHTLLLGWAAAPPGKAFLSGISLTGVKYLTQSESFSKIMRPAQERDLENRKRLSRFRFSAFFSDRITCGARARCCRHT